VAARSGLSSVPPVLRRNVLGAWGAAGERWLDDLPRLAASVAADWELELGAPFALSYHWVVAARRADGTPVVLKLGVPGEEHLAHEAAALQAFDGRGAVRLLERELDRGALLLERADPGKAITALVPDRDEEATTIVATLARRLHRPPALGCPLPELESLGVAFHDHLRDHRGDDPLPRRLVDRAAGLFSELCATASERLVLHGDLHHGNVLSATREPLLAIDPHGLIGDPGYEAGPLLSNPDLDRDERLLESVPARAEQLAAALGLPRERILAWGFVEAMLSEVWTFQARGAVRTRALDVALRLAPLVP
jgi:streptomycin 6-kinase